MENLELKTCRECKETKPRDRYTKDSKSRDKLATKCKDCIRLYTIRKKETALGIWIDESDPTTLIGCNHCGYRELFLGAEIARNALTTHRSIPHPVTK